MEKFALPKRPITAPLSNAKMIDINERKLTLTALTEVPYALLVAYTHNTI